MGTSFTSFLRNTGLCLTTRSPPVVQIEVILEHLDCLLYLGGLEFPLDVTCQTFVDGKGQWWFLISSALRMVVLDLLQQWMCTILSTSCCGTVQHQGLDHYLHVLCLSLPEPQAESISIHYKLASGIQKLAQTVPLAYPSSWLIKRNQDSLTFTFVFNHFSRHSDSIVMNTFQYRL